TNRGGILHKDEQQLQLLEDELAAAKNIDRLRVEKAQLIAQKEMDAAALFAKKSAVFNDIKNAEKNAKYLKLKEFAELGEQYEECEAKLSLSNGQIADKTFCDTLRQKITDIKLKQTALDAKRKESERLLQQISLLEKSAADDKNDILVNTLNSKERLVKQLSEKQAQLSNTVTDITDSEKQLLSLKGKPNFALIIIGALLTVTFAIVPFVISMLYLLGFAAVGIILLSLGFALKSKPDGSTIEQQLNTLKTPKAQLEKEIEQLQSDVEYANEQYNMLLVSKNTDQNLINSKRTDATRIMTELSRMQLELNDALSDALNFCATLKRAADIADAEQILSETEQLLASLETLRAKTEYAAKGTGCHSLAQAKELLALLQKSQGETPTGDLESLKAELDNLNNQHSTLTQELAALKAEAAKEYSGIKSPAQVENEIALHKAKMQEKEDYLNILKIAAEALESADAEQRSSFSHILDSKALAIFSEITNGKYDGLMISKDLEISVSGDNSFGTQKLSSLSRGANDQAYFALRLALAEQIGEQSGALPVLLDDVFSQYDDKRKAAAFEFIKTYSANNQTLFFTCHNVCVDLAKNLGANIIKL
ncbi:MAG: hypothetical protein J6S00_04095, partial [Clostridia bacterium]|nr:hypothetical protein [Clostridia bacterium]